MKLDKFFFISIIIIGAVSSRFIPHPPNFTPITAIALFGGTYFSEKKLAFIIPLLVMFLSDLYLGLHSLIPFVYGSFVIITLLGLKLREQKSLQKVALSSFAGSVIFFIITNFAVWLVGSFYPKNNEGLIACFVAGIPFFKNTLLGDLFFTIILFGSFELINNFYLKPDKVKI